MGLFYPRQPSGLLNNVFVTLRSIMFRFSASVSANFIAALSVGNFSFRISLEYVEPPGSTPPSLGRSGNLVSSFFDLRTISYGYFISNSYQKMNLAH